GAELVGHMIFRNMLIDVAHLSERAVRDVYQIASRRFNYYPLYNSHTRFAAVLTAEDAALQREFVTTEEQIGFIRETGGIVGLRTGQNAILTVINDAEGVLNDCDGSSKSFAQLLSYG